MIIKDLIMEYKKNKIKYEKKIIDKIKKETSDSLRKTAKTIDEWWPKIDT